MACPFFHPVERFQDGAWLQPPRLPLGDPCRGECRAAPSAPVQPSDEQLRQYCNSGYARDRCSNFAGGPEAADAVRFSITRDEADAIGVLYIFEKDYGPLRHGPLTYNRASAQFAETPESDTLAAQAAKFVESYLSRRIKA